LISLPGKCMQYDAYAICEDIIGLLDNSGILSSQLSWSAW